MRNISDKVGAGEVAVELKAMLTDPACENRAFIEEELARTEKVLKIIGRALPR